jgi:prepilin-type N-terminal cleavage/methylation domain-containing protein/prepilin-type processing-associated H-X9-DG protein
MPTPATSRPPFAGRSFHVTAYRSQDRSPRGAFTLVELLVVIGIIALLISILLPSLNRARENAKQLTCLSNMRQLGVAFSMYVDGNKGRFPTSGVGGGGWTPADWIFWEDVGPNRRLEDSAIARYLAKPIKKEYFRCPSDVLEARPAPGVYKFSYSSNYLITKLPAMGSWIGIYAPDKNEPLRITEIVNPPDKILLIDESNDTLDDGCWAWQTTFGSGRNVLSHRHDKTLSKELAAQDPKAGRGNVLMADGHAEFVPRKASFDPFHFDPKKKR